MLPIRFLQCVYTLLVNFHLNCNMGRLESENGNIVREKEEREDKKEDTEMTWSNKGNRVDERGKGEMHGG